MKNKKLLFGLSANPIHNGHLIAARCVAEKLNINSVTLVPSKSPQKDPSLMADGEHRYMMCCNAIRGERWFSVSDYEITKQGTTYTYDTIEYFRKSGDEIFWLIGTDQFVNFHTWHRWREILGIATVVVASRPGYTETTSEVNPRDFIFVDTPLVEFSATNIRQRLKDGKSIRYLVPESVQTLLCTHQLYR